MTSQLLVLLAALALLPALARADYEGAGSRARSGPLIIEVPQAGEPAPQAQQASASPPTAPPEQAPPSAPPSTSQSAPAAEGGWVYSAQYGWIWVPYSDVDAQVPPSGHGTSYVVYVYYASRGSTWVVAPWGWGHFGLHDSWRFSHGHHSRGFKPFHGKSNIVRPSHGVRPSRGIPTGVRPHRGVRAPGSFHGRVPSR